MQASRDYAVLALRIGLGALFVYFGALAVSDPAGQLSWLADWVYQLPIIGTQAFIRVFGALEVLLGLALIIGAYPRYAALLGAAALLGIVVNLGLNEIAYRDFVLVLACLVLACQQRFTWSLTQNQ